MQHATRFLAVMLCCLATHAAFAQAKSSLFLKLPLRKEWHNFDVGSAQAQFPKGSIRERNMNWGVGLGFSRSLSRRVELNLGVDYLRYKSRIAREVNGKELNRKEATLLATNNTTYNLLSIPAGVDLVVLRKGKAQVAVGTAFAVHLNFENTYRYDNKLAGKKSEFRFFGVNHSLSLSYKQDLSRRSYFQLRPFVTTFETWRKDAALSENGEQFHKNRFNSVGVNFHFGFYL